MGLTVREFIEQFLWDWMDEEDAFACMEYAIQELNQTKDGGLMRKDGQIVALIKCWNTERDDYPMEVTDALQHSVEVKALEWCAKQLKIQKAALQEIHRLSGTVLKDQEMAE